MHQNSSLFFYPEMQTLKANLSTFSATIMYLKCFCRSKLLFLCTSALIHNRSAFEYSEYSYLRIILVFYILHGLTPRDTQICKHIFGLPSNMFQCSCVPKSLIICIQSYYPQKQQYQPLLIYLCYHYVEFQKFDVLSSNK